MSEINANKNQIFIDYREKALIEHMKKSCEWNDESCVIKNLDIGDIQIFQNDSLLYIIERKTLSDLWSSIKDGRYKEQKLRLKGLNINNNNIYFLIETNSDQKRRQFMTLPQKVKIGFFINTLFNDHMKILTSNNIEETSLILFSLLKKLNEKKINSITESNSSNDYSDVIHVQKKKNMTPKNCFIAQLAQIPLMSSKYAKPIVEQFGNMVDFCKELDKHDDTSKLTLLQKFDGIGNKKAKSIINYLYGQK